MQVVRVVDAIISSDGEELERVEMVSVVSRSIAAGRTGESVGSGASDESPRSATCVVGVNFWAIERRRIEHSLSQIPQSRYR